jgi:Zn-dependent peptidase ImmA (M78 family)
VAAALALSEEEVQQLLDGRRSLELKDLARLKALSGRSLEQLITEPLESVVQWRAEHASTPATAGADSGFDVVIDFLDVTGRTVSHLLQVKAYRPSSPGPIPAMKSLDEASHLAGWARRQAAVGNGPLMALQAACERLSMLAFVVDLDTPADGAYARIDGATGVCWVQARSETGRRRFTLAHELGHHLAGDRCLVDAAGTDAAGEALINAFAINFLMPARSVASRWNVLTDSHPRERAARIAAEYAVSWSAACYQLNNARVIDVGTRDDLLKRPPTAADLQRLNIHIPQGNEQPSPALYQDATKRAFKNRHLSRQRFEALMPGAALPDRRPLPQHVQDRLSAPVPRPRRRTTES